MTGPEAQLLKSHTTVANAEPFKASTLRRLCERTPAGARIVNEHGPTEVTVGCLMFRADSWDSSGAESVPLGRPLPNTRAYVLDAFLRPIPTGTPGELYIAGVQLARGYLNRPALTAERFVANPYGPPGSRMYRTGDLVRWNSRGLLESLGRTDHQVKLRGFRIEPGEIEATLGIDPAVKHAVVVVREDRPGEPLLVAYVVPATPRTVVDTDTLRKRVTTSLPDYMIPSAFVTLTELPLTDNGKLDRNALPRPTATATGAGRPPRDDHEAVLCRLFGEFLDVPNVTVDDGFFALGGHSLLAARLAARIRQTLGISTTVREIFSHPTPAALATVLSREERHSRPALTPRRRPPEQNA